MNHLLHLSDFGDQIKILFSELGIQLTHKTLEIPFAVPPKESVYVCVHTPICVTRQKQTAPLRTSILILRQPHSSTKTVVCLQEDSCTS